MDNVVKVIIKDRIINKTVALKVKEETPIQRIFEILVKKYDHPQKGNIQNVLFTFQGEELPLEMPLSELIEKRGFTEEDRIEIQERTKASKPLTTEKKDFDFVKMMSKGGAEFSKAIIEILIKGQVLTREIAESALYSANLENRSVVTSLIEGGYIKEKDILATVSRHLEISSVDLEGITISPDILDLIHKNEAEYYCILPIRKTGKRLAVAVVNPFDAETMNEIKMVTGTEIEPLLSTELSIRAKIKSLYQRKSIQEEKPNSIPAPIPIMDWNEQNDVESNPFSSKINEEKIVPFKTEKNKLIIKDGRKIDAKDFSPEECNLPTIWEDKKLPDQDDWEEEKMQWKKTDTSSRKGKQENTKKEENIVEGIDLSDIGSFPEAISYDIPADIALENNQSPEANFEESPSLPEGIPVLANADSDIPDALEVGSTQQEENMPSESAPFEEGSTDQNQQDKDDEWLIISADKDPHAISDTLKTLPFSVPDKVHLESSPFVMTEEEKELENLLRNDIPKNEPGELSIPEGKADLDIPDSFSLNFGGTEEEEDNIVSSDLVQTQKVASFQRDKTPLPSPAFTDNEDLLDTIIERQKEVSVKKEGIEENIASVEPGKEILLDSRKPELQRDVESEKIAPEKPKKQTENFEAKSKKEISDVQPIEEDLKKEKPAKKEKTVGIVREEAIDRIADKPKPAAEDAIPKKETSAVVLPPSKISREVTVRYYKIMNPLRNYPLVVLFSRKKLQKMVQDANEEIAQNTGTSMQVDANKPIVKIVPYLPGCLSTPQDVPLDISPEESYAKIWITPLCSGKIEDAKIQLWYQGKCMQSIPLAIKVVQQRAVKIAAFIGFFLPLITFIYEIFEINLPKQYAFLENIKKIIEFSGGVANFGFILGAVCILMAFVFYGFKKPKQAKPIVDMVDFT
ncbi:MAG: hypothetical protein HUU50_00075 [Candidatus Brocadiae bacterium]|nr:hypothetical protein [Candidatus Brocadiia bacterium]